MAGVLLLGVGTAQAGNIDPKQAREAAATYMRWVGDREGLSANELQLVQVVTNPRLDVPAAYYFNLPGEGWIFLAGTTVIDPVIAYFHQGRLDMDRLPDNMRWWLDGYIGMVMEIQDDDVRNAFSDSPQWTDLANGKPGGGHKAGERYLMQANWGQGDELHPTYNRFCPVVPDVDTQRGIDSTCIVGCVATAASMICHYYRYPVKPKGTVRYTWQKAGKSLALQLDTITFDYSLMPNRLTNGSSEDQVLEVARICRAVGYGVNMNYGPQGSGAFSRKVPGAMKNYFKYKLGQQRFRSGDSDTGFVYSIRRELLKKNILYMSGSSSTNQGGRDAAGHAWVCAGYRDQDSNFYFMNWGWDAGGNGFFNVGLNDMRISGYGYNFNLGQAVILGMTPPDDSNRFVVGIRDVAVPTLGYAYPNPAALTVTLPYTTQQPAELNIYAIDGKLVQTRRVQAGQGEVEVNVEGMPAGIYIYRMGAATGKFIVK